MDVNQARDESMIRSKAKCRAGFDRWLSEPLIRLTISMIPANEQKETLQLLLQSAFEAGFNSGAGDIVSQIAERVFQRRPPE